jgi:hypothetical protein
VTPSSSPNCSRIVITSARAWHGWNSSVKPLMTATLAASASASTSVWWNVRIMIPST